MAFALTQRAYRFYSDGTESGSVALAAENTNITVTDTANVNVLLRVGLQESGSGSFSGATTDDFQLQVSKNGGAYANVTAASANVKGFASANLTDAGTTTNRLSAGTGAFVAGEISETGLVTDRQITANNFSELLYALTFVGADVANNDTFDFRVLLNGATITYTVTPRVTTASATAHTMPAAQGSYALTGQTANFKRAYVLAAARGTYTLTGRSLYSQSSQDDGYRITEAEDRRVLENGDPRVTEGFISPIAAAVGTYTLTGQVVTLRRALKLTAAQGTYTLTGQAAATRYGRSIIASQGSYTLTGQAVAFKRTYRLVAAQGSYLLTGQTATLSKARRLTAAQGAYALTGQAATLSRAVKLTAAFGTYALSGQAVAFKSVHALLASRGTYVLTGQAAGLAKSSAALIGASTGTYALTGQSVGFSKHHRLTADAGVYTLTGFGVTLTQVGLPAPTVTQRRGGIRPPLPELEPQLDYAALFREDEEILTAITALLTLRGHHETTVRV